MYLNPSDEDSNGRPNVFVYVGDNPHIEDGIPVVYITPYDGS